MSATTLGTGTRASKFWIRKLNDGPVPNGPTLVRTNRPWSKLAYPGLDSWTSTRTTLTRYRSSWNLYTIAQTDQAKIWNLPYILHTYSKTCDLRTILISFYIVSLVPRWANKRVFSCSSKIAEIREKIYKNYFVRRFPWNRSYADWQVLAWVAIYPLFLVTWVEKMTCWAKIQSFQPWKHKHKCWSLPFPGQSPLLNLAGHFFNSSQ